MKQKPSRFVHRFFFVSLLGTAGLLNEHLYAADDLEQFKTQKIAPDIIIPEKIGQQYYSRHSVISDEFRMLESEQEEARKKADEQLNAARDKLKRSEEVLKQAEQRLQAAVRKARRYPMPSPPREMMRRRHATTLKIK